MSAKNPAVFCAVAAAALYAINIPLSKILLNHIDEVMLAGLLYLGAGMGLFICGQAEKISGKCKKRDMLTVGELPYTIAMIVLDIFAPILLMFGISFTNSANVSLLNNFEIVATSIIALVIFGEVITKRLWSAIFMVTVASIILSFEGKDAFVFNNGSIMVLGACVCWGFENNCTRMLSNKSPIEIVVIKGIFSGMGSFIIALITGENMPALIWTVAALLLGFISYGLSISLYINAQKELGAAKTSAYYSIAPFIGAFMGIVILGEGLTFRFCTALLIMIAATVVMAMDSITLQHTHMHEHTHTHAHRHGDIVHTHEHTHTHAHMHTHEGDTERHTHTHSDLGDHTHSHSGI